MSEYVTIRRKVYQGGATFVPVCRTCGRFVKADEIIKLKGETGPEGIPNATCSKCGRTEMIFEGFM